MQDFDKKCPGVLPPGWEGTHLPEFPMLSAPVFSTLHRYCLW